MVNAFSAAINMQDILVSMQVLATEGVDVKSITVKNSKESVLIQVEGMIRASSYEQLQSRYENLLGEVRKSGKAEVQSQKLDLKNKKFTVGLKWKI